MKPRRRQPERALQRAITEFSAAALPAGVWWGCIPGGDGKVTTAPGYRPGTPDWLVIHEGRALFFELKSKRGVASVAQNDCGHQLHQAGAAVHLIRTLEGYEEALRLGGVPLRATASGKRLLEAAREKAA